MRLPSPKAYDAILAGGGAAGLSLAYQLHQTFPDLRILIVDEQAKTRNDHTWCYWTQRSTYLDEIVYRTWDRLQVVSETYDATFELAPYRYKMVRAIDFYRFIRAVLGGKPKVDFLVGTVERVADGSDDAEILVNALTYRAPWVFDSRFRASEYRPLTQRYHYLVQHFLGWEIESAEHLFDPEVPRIFDFRTPQKGAMRFVYILPYATNRALVEYTVFSTEMLVMEQYRAALKAYIDTVLGAQSYHILAEEHHTIPMTEHPAPRRAGRHVMNIGTRGGRVKPSSGYAFTRIQRDAAAIVHSLQAHGHPFHVPASPRRYRLYDTLLLDVLERHGELGKRIFLRLFQRNSVQRVFRFLDEEGGLRENLQLLNSIPRWPFIRASIGTAISGRLP